MQAPSGYNGGNIKIYQDEQLLAITELEIVDGLAEFAIPILDLNVVGQEATIQVRTSLEYSDSNWCHDDWDDPATLTNLSMTYAGEPALPMVISEYLPSVLDRISIYIPQEPSESESAAAIELSSALSAQYRTQNPEIDLISLAAGESSPRASADAFERKFVISDQEDSEVVLENPGADSMFLRISGQGNALVDQARLLSSELLPLVNTNSAELASHAEIPQLEPRSMTVEELGNFTLETEGIGRTSVNIGFDQSRMGSFPTELEVNLSGGYVPLPADMNGQLIFHIGDTVIDQLPLNQGGEFNHTLLIPQDLFSRFPQLEVELRSTGTVECNVTQPLSLWIDPKSTVNTELSDTPENAGFLSLPQGFIPTVNVALAEGDFADVQRAVSIIDGVQMLGTTRLRPELVSWEDAIVSQQPAVLIDAGGESSTDLSLPVETENGVLTVEGSEDVINLDQLEYGGIETFWDEENSRMLLVASSAGDPAELDRVLNWLDQDQDRWYELSGQALLQSVGNLGDPMEVTVSAAQLDQQPSTDKTAWIVGAVLLSLLTVGVIAIVLRSRARSRASKAEGDDLNLEQR
ncbi:hypothetical protein C5L39_03210 [Corynebacterium alimapuense]|uniref:Uncharacterized protein n=2 Tax=Corynebacterium alimapuense TaxID=1576874 RepID=A0A3M8K899_9CORY|nr:hypothetical protein C5L39_03210 [Corynebacterium alimapuense]